MSRTASVGLAALLATDAHTRCSMVRLDLNDGTSLAFTDHDQTLSFNLGDGSIDYLPDTGILPSDLSLSTGFDANDMEISGPLSEIVTRTAVVGGRFDEAVVRYFFVNWSDLTQGPGKLAKGYVVKAEAEGGKFKLTVHSEISKFAQTIGDVTGLYCRYSFGTAPCPAVPVTLSATVSSVTDERAFAVTFAGTHASNFFNRGTVQFTSGALSGTRKVEIFTFTGGTGSGSVVLWTGLADAPEVGDTLTITQGCFDLASGQSKTRAACVALLGDATDFGGEPDIPGRDEMLTYPTPKA